MSISAITNFKYKTCSNQKRTKIKHSFRERSAKNINVRKVETPKPFSGHSSKVPAKSILKQNNGPKFKQKKKSIIFNSPKRDHKSSSATSKTKVK